MNILNIKKPRCCEWISVESWEGMDMKERDFIIYTHERKYTKEQIMRKLHISSYSSYWRIWKKAKLKLEGDVAICNEVYKNNSKKHIKS